ncbi:MAG: hypothetical protein Q9218_003578 [Villophora microphyllina]
MAKGESLVRRDDPLEACLSGIYDAACWDVLNMTDWLSNWNTRIRPCDTSDSSNCRAPGELWTDTFLRVAQNEQREYKKRRTQAINSFFSNWYQAMYNAAIEAEGLIIDIVELIDPPTKSSRVFVSDLLSALAAGLAFLAIPEAAALGGAGAAIAPIFLRAIQQAPGVAKII